MRKIIIRMATRNGTQDLWNAFMVQKANFTENDIPTSSPSTTIPKNVIGWDDAKAIYKKLILKDKTFRYPAFIHFYIDDQKFDGKTNSIWLYPKRALKIIKHFAGIISPDFSTYYDFPKYIKGFNIYRMRAFDCYMELESVPYIHNVRWGTEETWDYCFDGIPKGSTVAIGTIASGLRKKENRRLFEEGFRTMISTLQPKAIIIYGSENYAVIQEAKDKGILIISFESKTSLAFKQRGRKQP